MEGSKALWHPAVPGFLLGLLVLWAPSSAHARCDEATRAEIEAGEALEIAISPTGGTVTIRTPRTICEEPLSEWSRWDPPAVKPAARDAATPPAPAAAVPRPPVSAAPPQKPSANGTSPPTPSPPPPVVREVPLPPRTPPPVPLVPAPWTVAPPATAETVVAAPFVPHWRDSKCLPIASRWNAATFRIGDKSYNLARIFTIDHDGDSVNDNVGFILESNQAGALIIRYHARPGMFSAKSLAELRLEDDGDIARLCFGELTFPKHQSVAAAPVMVPFRIPNLAAQAREREASARPAEPQAPPPEKPAPPLSGDMVLYIVLALGGVAAAGGCAFFIVRRRKGDAPLPPPDVEPETDEAEA